jgi:hypothetical protein
MAVYNLDNLGEKDIEVVRVVLASFGSFAAIMMDIDRRNGAESRTRRGTLDTLMTGDLTMGKRNPRLQHTAQYGVLRTRRHRSYRGITKRESMSKRHHHRGAEEKSEIKIKMVIYGDAIGE